MVYRYIKEEKLLIKHHRIKASIKPHTGQIGLEVSKFRMLAALLRLYVKMAKNPG